MMLDLPAGLWDLWRSLVVILIWGSLRLSEVGDGAHVPLDAIPIRPPIQFREMFRSDVAPVLEQLCRENDVRLVRVLIS
jgi:hypothetical protein